MGKPVNAMTGDAPDGQNPDKKFVPPAPEGKWKYTPPPPPKVKPKDEGIFTEEMLRRSGGKMKEPPFDPEGKKRGGSIKKRRFDEGGEVEDKAAGLKASKGEDVGFFKRLMMGNIDQPGSEAYEKFGAGRGKAAREAAAESARESGRTVERYKPAAVETEKPVAPVASVATKPDKYSDYGDNADAGTSYSTTANKPSVNKPSANKPSVSSRPSVNADIRPSSTSSRGAEQGMSRGMRDTDTRNAEQGRSRGMRGEGPSSPVRDYKAEEKRQQDAEDHYKRITSNPGRDAIEGVYPEEFLIPGGKAAKYVLNALKGGAKPVGSTSRALAEYETPITFLGKGAQKNITPMERLGTEQAKRLTYDEAQGIASNATPRVGGPRTQAQKEIAETIARLKQSKSGGSSGAPVRQRSPKDMTSFKSEDELGIEFKRGGNIKRYASGGSVSASSRGDGCAQRGKTRGMMR